MSKVRSFKAIVTRYHGPSKVKGSRVKATSAAGSITLHWDDALNSEDNHIAAAKALANKFKWVGGWHYGTLPDGRTAFVCADLENGPVFSSYPK